MRHRQRRPQRPERIANTWGEDLYFFDLDFAVECFRSCLVLGGGRPHAGLYGIAGDAFDWFEGHPFDPVGRKVFRPAEEAARWRQRADTFYGAHRRVEMAARDCLSGRIDVSEAVERVRRAGEDLLRVFGPMLEARRAEQASAPRRRDERPEQVGVFKLAQDALDRIGRTGVGRWYVALTEILREAIRVVPKNRPGIGAIVTMARKLTAGGDFPDVKALEAGLHGAAGVRLGRLTHRPRGGRGKRSIGAVVAELRRAFDVTKPDWQIVIEAVAATGIKSTLGLSKHLRWSQRRVAAARQLIPSKAS